MIIGSGVLGGAAGLGGWGLLADARLVPGRSLLDGLLGRCDISATPREAEPGRVLRSSFYSRKRNRSVNYMIAYPPATAAGARLPVCLLLHGLGEDERTGFDGLRLHRLVAGAMTSQSPRFVLAAVSGGDGYWHPRPGDDPLGMVLEEWPVVLAQHGLPVDRFGLLGWSMGGYGALVAASEQPARFPVVVADAPAFWLSYEDARSANPTAFTSADEWRAWGDLTTRTDKLADLTLRIDCGESDPFEPAVSDLRDRLPDPSVVHITPGCHDGAFWRSVAPAQIRLISQVLGTAKTS